MDGIAGDPARILGCQEVAVGYSKSNTSPILKLFLSRLEELQVPTPDKKKLGA